MDEDNYIKLDTQPFSHIGQEFQLVQSSQIMSHRSESSCMSALIRNDVTSINNDCSFTIATNSLTPSILFVGQSTLLLTNISTYSLTWTNGTVTTHQGCTHCELTLPCATIFNSAAGSYIHQITKCTGIQDKPTVSHLLNLAFLSKFFNEETLLHFTADTKLQEALNVRLPTLPLFESNYTQDLADLSKTTLQLHGNYSYTN